MVIFCSFLCDYFLLFTHSKMEDKTYLCKCSACLKTDPIGVLLNLNTYNRHRKKQQELSVRDDIEEELDETELDEGHQDEMQIELQTKDLGLVDEENIKRKI